VVHLFARLLKDESGATAIEYGLITASISVAIIAGVQGVGARLVTVLIDVATGLQ
jgi:pilus assembly protein Flp/PilA